VRSKKGPTARDGRALKANFKNPIGPYSARAFQSQPQVQAALPARRPPPPAPLAAPAASGGRAGDGIAGRRFGCWTAVGADATGKRIGCVCDCGRSQILALDALESGTTKSCGCARLSRDQALALRREAERRLQRVDLEWRPGRGR